MKTGAKVVAFMRDGTQVLGRFKERKGRFVVLDTATINVSDLRTLGYWRQK